jgi:pyruvate kinase
MLERPEPRPEPCRFDLTWGPLEYHRRSLDNLQTAMKKTRRLCAIMLDTLGREVGSAAQHCIFTNFAP